MTGRIATVIVTATLTGALAAQQAQQPAEVPLPDVTFHVDVNYVEVDAVVTDANGMPVRNLTADDFELLEDGSPQTISAFSFVHVPIERRQQPVFASAPIPRDVVTNQGSEGRLYLLVLDDLHIGSSRTGRLRQIARMFLERHFGANDYGAVVYTGGRDVDGQDFTNDRQLLLAAVDRFSGQKLESATVAKIRVVQSAPSTSALPPTARSERRTVPSGNPNDPNLVDLQPDDPLTYERRTRAHLVMARVHQLAEFMAGVRGRRKALVLFSEGVEYDIEDSIGSSSGDFVVRETDEAIAAATRGNVSIYGIDPRVVEGLDEEMMQVGSSGLLDMGLGMPSLRRELQSAQAGLRYLASGTGGFAAVNQSGYARVFERIVEENSSYYLLGFSPVNARREGKYRNIDVRVKRPGLKVTRARHGYREARAVRTAAVPAPAPVVPAMQSLASVGLTSPLPLSGLPIKLFAGTYRASASQAMVALSIEVDVSTVDFDEQDGRFVQQIDVASVAIDPRGTIREQAGQVVDLVLTRERLAEAKREGVRVITGMTLDPGRYQLRVAVGTRGGRLGSVIRDLAIPNYTESPLTMSSVSLTSQLATAMPTTARANFLNLSLRGPVSAQRAFSRRDEITVYAEVYENEIQARHMLELRTVARAVDGQVAFAVTDQMWTRERPERGAYSHWARIPVSDLAPGDYVLELEARSLIQPQRSVKRQLEIRVQE